MHGEKFVLKYCVQKKLLNLKDSKLTQNFYGSCQTGRVTYTVYRLLFALKKFRGFRGLLHDRKSF